MSKKTKKIDWKIVVAAIAALTILECFAMHYGINGWLLRVVVFIIAGLAGLVLESPVKLK